MSRPRNTRPHRRRSGIRRPGPAVVVLSFAAIAAVVWSIATRYRAERVSLEFTVAEGSVPPVDLTVFPDLVSFELPSPPPALARIETRSGRGFFVFDRSVVPDRAAVRYRAEGFGAGIAYVELGQELPSIRLAPPRAVHGRVFVAMGFWLFCPLSLGLLPIGQAEVVAMAGGARGFPLVRTRTSPDGSFRLSGIGRDVHPLTLRVRAPGCAIVHVEAPPYHDGEDDEIPVPVEVTKLLRGRVEAPEGVDRADLWVLARGLPGVQARVGADGTFAVDHVPPNMRPRFFLYGIGPLHAATDVTADPGDAVTFVVRPAGVVRGLVVDDVGGEPLARAFVFTRDGASAVTGEDGTFVMEHVLPGKIALTAQYRPPRRPRQPPAEQRVGRLVVEVEAGRTVDGVVVRIEE